MTNDRDTTRTIIWDIFMSKPFFTYILHCSDGSYYVGHTDDLSKRLDEHQSKTGGVYTSKRCPVRLVWSQEFFTREEAKEAEIRIKGWSRAKKFALIQGDYNTISLLAKKINWIGYSNGKVN